MLREPTHDKLAELRLGAMAEAWQQQSADAEIGSLTFEERFGMLVDAEWLARKNKRLARLLREAKLRLPNACIEEVTCTPARKLDKKLVRELGSCTWIDNHINCVISGATGVGKTYLCCALAQQACRKGYRVTYRRAPRLFDELRLARADGTYATVLARLARLDLLVVDDWALVPTGDAERRDLLEIMEDRYGNRSTILASQLPIEKWHDYVGDPTIADAICDRLLHNAHRIVLQGPSMRISDAMKK